MWWHLVRNPVSMIHPKIVWACREILEVILHVEVDVIVLEGKKVNSEGCVLKQRPPSFFSELLPSSIGGNRPKCRDICAQSGAISASTPC